MVRSSEVIIRGDRDGMVRRSEGIIRGDGKEIRRDNKRRW